MRRREKIKDKTPELMISPMIDLIFLLLAFFIISTMYMTEVRTISIELPNAESAEVVHKSSSLVSVKKDSTYWLDEKEMPLDRLVEEVKVRSGANPGYSVVIRGEKEARYNDVIRVLDACKNAGLTHFGLAAGQGEADG
ncbi:MAG: biopolymer transporter ExbD [Dialister sp.]|nr:biopolymer transporter ExbD [Dialister sp.]